MELIAGNYYQTQGYGLTPFARTAKGKQYYASWGGEHKGRDYGTSGRHLKTLATVSGRINYAGVNAGYGNYVEILGVDGWLRQYAHLDAILVKKGDVVSIGDAVGTVGNTGSSTAVHLHYGHRRRKMGRWEYRDPIADLADKPKEADAPDNKLVKAKNDPTVYVNNGDGTLFPIPNWHTFVTLFGEKAPIHEASSDIIEKMPKGAMLTDMSITSTPVVSNELPDEYSVTVPHEDQGKYPICVAISAIRAMEYQYEKKYGHRIEFSVPQAFIEAGGSHGGVQLKRLLKSMKERGVIAAEHNKLKSAGKLEDDWLNKWRERAEVAKNNKRYYLEDYTQIVTKAGSHAHRAAIRESIYKYGPVIATINAEEKWYNGVMPSGKKWKRTHKILLSGWDHKGWIGNNSWSATSSGGAVVNVHNEYPFAFVYSLKGIK
jgi:hypothetical protein